MKIENWGDEGKEGTRRRRCTWERRHVDFSLNASRRARAAREPSRGRRWPIPRPQRVHALQSGTDASECLEMAEVRGVIEAKLIDVV